MNRATRSRVSGPLVSRAHFLRHIARKLAFLTIAPVLFAPFVTRLLHRLHLDLHGEEMPRDSVASEANRR